MKRSDVGGSEISRAQQLIQPDSRTARTNAVRNFFALLGMIILAGTVNRSCVRPRQFNRSAFFPIPEFHVG